MFAFAHHAVNVCLPFTVLRSPLLSARVYRLQTAQYALGNRSVFVHRSGLIHSASAFRNFEAEKTI